MGRKSRIDESVLFAAVGTHLAVNGSIRIQDIVEATGTSVGSIYHRYGSREMLLARAWVDAVQHFQAAFLSNLESGQANSGEQAALATPRFCRQDPVRARLLICCRREELLSHDISAELNAEISQINASAYKRVKHFAQQQGIGLEACRLGMIAFPLGAVRMYLPNWPLPEAIDDYIAQAYHAVVSKNDST